MNGIQFVVSCNASGTLCYYYYYWRLTVEKISVLQISLNMHRNNEDVDDIHPVTGKLIQIIKSY